MAVVSAAIAILIGTVAGALARDTAPTRVLGPAGAVVDSKLPGLQPPAGAPLASKTQDGFTVELHRAMPSATGDLVVFYRVRVEGDGAFGDMLGIPRVINPDGSFALPREYGAAGSVGDDLGGTPGLPAATQAAIFESAQVQPGALFRSGPFFRSSNAPFTLTATGEALAAGVQTTIGGEPFSVTAIENGDGTTSIQLVNTRPGATIVATHPGSRVSVVVDGKELPEVHGSTSFAKTVGYEVNANRSTIDVAGRIPAGATVEIVSSSIGHVLRGAWDFPLD
ncbi:MAG: hypothetical protein IH609_02265 [Dehalococcoidia bacterium]|nr:hypothetical protein [Dehalococcoidia bacterium]